MWPLLLKFIGEQDSQKKLRQGLRQNWKEGDLLIASETDISPILLISSKAVIYDAFKSMFFSLCAKTWLPVDSPNHWFDPAPVRPK